METRKSFVRYISHELRTPLNTVFMGLKLAIQRLQSESDKPYTVPSVSSKSVTRRHSLKDTEKGNEQNEILQEISLACGVAVEILNEFLMFDKLEQDTLALNKQEVGVIDFMTSAIKMIFVQIREKKIDLVLVNYLSKDSNSLLPTVSGEVDTMFHHSHDHIEQATGYFHQQLSEAMYDDRCYIDPLDVINIDKHKLSQVMRNLLSNAIKFTPTGGKIIVTIKFEPVPCVNTTGECEHLSGTLIISVTDTGAGMSEIDQKRLFKEVVQFRPHELQAGGGSGLGLMITKGIVDLHESTIEVYSAGELCGSTFTVKIPMTRTIACSSSAKSMGSYCCSSKSICEEADVRVSTITAARRSYVDLTKLVSGSDVSEKEKEISNKKVARQSSHSRTSIKRIQSFDDNLFSVNSIRKQSQTVLSQRFSQYESLLAKNHNAHPLQLTPAAIAQFTGVRRGSVTSEMSEVAATGNVNVNGTQRDHNHPAVKRELKFESPNNRISTSSLESASWDYDCDGSMSTEQLNPLPSPQSFQSDCTNSPKRSLKLLVVDDSGMSRKMMCRILKSDGHSVDEAEDGEKAVAAVKLNASYDAILMDSHMPKMNGPEAANIMRLLGYKGVILGITGDTADKDLDNFLRHGASKVLIKPVDLNDIKLAVMSAD